MSQTSRWEIVTTKMRARGVDQMVDVWIVRILVPLSKSGWKEVSSLLRKIGSSFYTRKRGENGFVFYSKPNEMVIAKALENLSEYEKEA